jgi:hypothetical protein
MRRPRLRTWLPFALTAIVGLIVLIVLGLSDHRERVYVLRAPNPVPVATLADGQRACEGPVPATAAIAGVRVWGAGLKGVASLRLDLRSHGNVLATGAVSVPARYGAYTAILNRPLRRQGRVTVCVSATGRTPFLLLGNPPIVPGVHLTLVGRPSPNQFSVALVGRPTSNLSQLSTAFSHAALFRPSWVGPWIFWLLLVGFLAATVCAGFAINAAARADAQSGRDDD